MKTEKVKKSAAVLIAIGVITTAGVWIVDTEETPYNVAMVNEELVDAEDLYKDKCLTFNSIEEAEAEQLRIDLIYGYAEEVEGEIIYKFSTKHAYDIQEHPDKNKWMICYSKVDGMKNKQTNVELFDEVKLGKMKKKDDTEILEFTPDVL